MDNWICKADSEIPVVCGDAFPVGDTINTKAIGHLKYVLNDVDDIRRSYFMLGFHLSEIKRCNIYFDFGYDNMKDFCINNVPVDYSILTRCIAVYERFCEHAENCFYTNRLNPKYEGFSFSQLVELMDLSFNSSDLPRLKNYSVVKLRDLKKFCLSRYGKNGYNSKFIDYYEASLNVVDNCDVATDEPEHDNFDVTADESESNNCNVAADEPESSNCDAATVESESSNCDVATDESESGNCDVATEKDKKAELNAIVFEKLSMLKGVVLRSFVRGFPASRKINVTLYDKSGKKIHGGAIECDVIYSDDDTLHIRTSEITLT